MTGLDPIRNNSSSQLTGVNHEAKPAQADGRRDKGVRALLSKVADRIFNNGGVREKVFESLKKHSGKVLDVLKDAPKGLGKLGTKVATALKGVKNLFSTADSKTNTQRQVGFNSPSLSRSQSFGSVSQNPIGQNVADGRAKLGRVESVYEEMPPFDSNPNAMDAQEVKALDDRIALYNTIFQIVFVDDNDRAKYAKDLAKIAANPDAPPTITLKAREVICDNYLEDFLTQEEQEKAGVGERQTADDLGEAAVNSDEGEADGAEVKSPRESIDANGEGLEEVSENVEPNKPSDAGKANEDDVLKNLGNQIQEDAEPNQPSDAGKANEDDRHDDLDQLFQEFLEPNKPSAAGKSNEDARTGIQDFQSQEDYEPTKPSAAGKANEDDASDVLDKLSQEGMEKSKTSNIEPFHIELANFEEMPFAESRKDAEPNKPSDAAEKSVNSMEQEMQGLFDFIENKPKEDKSLNGQVSGDVESDELFEDAGAEIDEDVQTTTPELVWTEVPKLDKSAEASKADKAEINKEAESQSAPLSEEVKSSKPTKAGEPKLSEKAQELSDMLTEAVTRIEQEGKVFKEDQYNELKLIIDELVKQVRIDNAGYRDPAYVNEQIRDNVISTTAFQYIKNFEVNRTDFNKGSPSGYAFDLIKETRRENFR